MAAVIIAIPAIFYAVSHVLNTVLSFVNKLRYKTASHNHRKYKAQSIPCPVDFSIKHKFPCANAVHRLKDQVKNSVQEYLSATFAGPVRHTIKWNGEDLSTVTVGVSFGDSKKPDDPNVIAFGLADCLARIDARDRDAERV